MTHKRAKTCESEPEMGTESASLGTWGPQSKLKHTRTKNISNMGTFAPQQTVGTDLRQKLAVQGPSGAHHGMERTLWPKIVRPREPDERNTRNL